MLNFWKMHGLGNDYIVIDNRDSVIDERDLKNFAQKLCERRFSVGADGVLSVSDSSTADIRMRIFNADGSEAEMCGNGIRCFAKYCYEMGITPKNEVKIETLSGIKDTWMTIINGEVKSVKVDMGVPLLERNNIPMVGEGLCIDEELEVDNQKFKVTCLSVGNPHCVLFVDDVTTFPVQNIGPIIETHDLFPNRVNVEFVEVVNTKELRVRVWERGCGETLACGTGACASVVAGILLKKVGEKVTVHLSGGDLLIEYDKHILMTGDAEKVFSGRLP